MIGIWLSLTNVWIRHAYCKRNYHMHYPKLWQPGQYQQMNLYWIDNLITLLHYANLLSILRRQIITELVGLHFSLKNCGGVVVKFTSWAFKKFLEARREQTFSLPLPLLEILLWIVFGHLNESTGTVYCLTHGRIKFIQATT